MRPPSRSPPPARTSWRYGIWRPAVTACCSSCITEQFAIATRASGAKIWSTAGGGQPIGSLDAGRVQAGIRFAPSGDAVMLGGPYDTRIWAGTDTAADVVIENSDGHASRSITDGDDAEPVYAPNGRFVVVARDHDVKVIRLDLERVPLADTWAELADAIRARTTLCWRPPAPTAAAQAEYEACERRCARRP